MYVSLSISITRDVILPLYIEWWVHQAELGNVDAVKQHHIHPDTIPNIIAVQNWDRLIL